MTGMMVENSVLEQRLHLEWQLISDVIDKFVCILLDSLSILLLPGQLCNFPTNCNRGGEDMGKMMAIPADIVEQSTEM